MAKFPVVKEIKRKGCHTAQMKSQFTVAITTQSNRARLPETLYLSPTVAREKTGISGLVALAQQHPLLLYLQGKGAGK